MKMTVSTWKKDIFLIAMVFVNVHVIESQYYGRYLPCPKSYMDPDGDCLAGIGGKDYPMLTSIPITSFDCRQHTVKYVGYFADVETLCQVFHVCLSDGRRDSFLCPNGTLFNQQFLVCDWWFNVKCNEAQKLYTINEYLESPPNNFHLGPLTPKVIPIPNLGSPGLPVAMSASMSYNKNPSGPASNSGVSASKLFSNLFSLLNFKPTNSKTQQQLDKNEVRQTSDTSGADRGQTDWWSSIIQPRTKSDSTELSERTPDINKKSFIENTTKKMIVPGSPR